jgi:hypothetical protein
MIQNVNVIALAQAAAMVVGEEKAQAIALMYRVLDDAMFAGYELGRMDGQQGADEATDTAFDMGYESGVEVGHGDGYDSGYTDGVRDARRDPSMADATVASIVAAQGDLFDDYEPLDDYNDTPGCGDPYCHICGDPGDDFYNGDSGDETAR